MEVFDLQRFGGVGGVTPTDIYTDEQVAKEVDRVQGTVEENVAVCIDERPATSEQPIRPKKAGGILTDIFAIAVTRSPIVASSVHEEGIVSVMNKTADLYDKFEIKIGGHGGKEACGASAKFVEITQDAAQQGAKFNGAAKEDLGVIFDKNVWQEVVNNAGILAKELIMAEAEEDNEKRWDPKKLEDLIEDRGTFEELTGYNLHLDLDPDNKRHGHWAEAIKRNRKPATSNDRDKANIQFFQVDIWKIIEDAGELSIDDKSLKQLAHAAVLFQYATAFRLTSDQRML